MDPVTAALRVLHGLTVVRIVGHGGEGQVYSATNKVGEYVAIKTIFYGGDSRAYAEARKKADNESAGWSKIGYTTQILNLESYGALAFVMPLLEGLSLKQHARIGIPWDRLQGSKMAVLYFEQLVLLHNRRLGIGPLAHRDIKPSNVMIVQRPIQRRRQPRPSPAAEGQHAADADAGSGGRASGDNNGGGDRNGGVAGSTEQGAAAAASSAAEPSGSDRTSTTSTATSSSSSTTTTGRRGVVGGDVEYIPVIIDWGSAHVAKPDGSQDVKFPGQPTGSRGYFGPDINKSKQTYNIDVYASIPIVLHFLRYQGDCSLLKARMFDQMKRISAGTHDIVKQEKRCELYERAARAPFPIVEVAFEFYRSDPAACRLLITFLARMQAHGGSQRPSSLQCLRFFLRLHEYFFLVDGVARSRAAAAAATAAATAAAIAAAEEKQKEEKDGEEGQEEPREEEDEEQPQSSEGGNAVGSGGGSTEATGADRRRRQQHPTEPKDAGCDGSGSSFSGGGDDAAAISDVLRELACAAGEVPREVMPDEAALPPPPPAGETTGAGGAGAAAGTGGSGGGSSSSVDGGRKGEEGGSGSRRR